MKHVLLKEIEICRGGGHRNARGFTRTDLLAIVGVLMVLGLVMVPGWAATGRKAGMLECKNNLRQVAVAMDQYTKDHADSLPGPIWTGVFYTYRDDPNDGSMATYLATYLGLPAPDSTFRVAPPLQCPASVDAQPKLTPVPPLMVPVCFVAAAQITNAPGSYVYFPFGRPSTPYVAPAKTTQVRRPSEEWAMLDVDQRYLRSMGIVSSTYYQYIPHEPVHAARPGGTRPTFYRNTLFFDWSVRAQLTVQ